MHCLLVDDEPGIREGLAALLRRKGHVVETAGDCAGAHARLAASTYDLVITDWRLPDGTAASILAAARCPVVATSGHPEEVERHPAVREVLTKPVSPSRLLDLLAATEAAAAAAAPAVAPPLPTDVAELVAGARTVLGDGELLDDGTFVVLRAPLRDDAALPALEALGGDLRVLTPAGHPIVELRWYRDGRPDGALPVVAPDAPWPGAGPFAVDFSGAAPVPGAFAACLDRAAVARDRGQRVHFLNVPGPLRSWTSDQGRAHDMPMRDPVGPRLPTVLADLWS